MRIRYRSIVVWGVVCLALLAASVADASPGLYAFNAWPSYPSMHTYACPGGQLNAFRAPSGLKVIVQRVPGQSAVSVAMSVEGGSGYDKAGYRGTAHLLEHLLFRSTKNFPGGKLLLELDSVGARRGAVVDSRRVSFWEVVPRKELDLALRIEANRLDGFAVAKPELEREKQALLGEIVGLKSAPERSTQAWLLKRLHSNSALKSLVPEGVAEEIKQVQLPQLEEFYQARYLPTNSVLVVVGDVDVAEVQTRVAKLFGARRLRLASEDIAEALTSNSDINSGADNSPDTDQLEAPENGDGVLMYAAVSPRLGSAKLGAYLVANAVLAEGASSRLEGVLRRESIGGHAWRLADSNLVDGLHSFGWYLDSSLEPKQVAESVAKELDDLLSHPPNTEEIELGKHRALQRFYFDWQDLGRRALALARYSHELDYLRKVPAAIEKCNAREVREAFDSIIECAAQYQHVPTRGASQLRRESFPSALEAYAGGETYQRKQLKNGVTVLVWPDNSLPMVYVRGYLSGGALADPVKQPGLTAYIAGLLGKDTSLRDADRFQRELAGRGMRLEFSGDSQIVAINGSCLASDLPKFLDLLTEAVRYAQPSSATQQEVKRQLCSSLTSSQASPAERALWMFMAALYPPGHPFGRPAADQVTSINAFTAEDVSKQLAMVCQPENLVLAFSGDVNADTVIDEVGQRLFDWKGGDTLADWPEVPIPDRRVLTTSGGNSSALVCLGQLGPDRSSPDYPAFNLLCRILGGDSVSSRLAIRVIHLEHLGSSASVRVVPLRGKQPWAVVMQVDKDKVDRAVAIVKQELQRLRSTGPTDAEIERAVAGITGSWNVNMADSASRAAWLCSMEYHHISREEIDNYAGIYQNITRDNLIKVAQKWFVPDRLVVVKSWPQQQP